jgi:hypothetical protein
MLLVTVVAAGVFGGQGNPDSRHFAPKISLLFTRYQQHERIPICRAARQPEL